MGLRRKYLVSLQTSILTNSQCDFKDFVLQWCTDKGLPGFSTKPAQTIHAIKKLSGWSLRANYTDQATAACRRS
jgi:hypothetical protein